VHPSQINATGCGELVYIAERSCFNVVEAHGL
jgi:hypothetical protein